jgi:Tfp pilus assembly protein PilN
VGVTLFIENTVSSEIKTVQREITRLEAEKRRLRQIQQEEKRLTKIKSELEHKLKVVQELDRNREVPKPLYFFASEENVKNIWLDELKLTGNRITVAGNIWKVEEFPQFLKKVEEQIGTVLFRQTERVDYENKNLNFKTHFYHFEFGAEQNYGTSD